MGAQFNPFYHIIIEEKRKKEELARLEREKKYKEKLKQKEEQDAQGTISK